MEAIKVTDDFGKVLGWTVVKIDIVGNDVEFYFREFTSETWIGGVLSHQELASEKEAIKFINSLKQ
jgi:hypothetical protein